MFKERKNAVFNVIFFLPFLVFVLIFKLFWFCFRLHHFSVKTSFNQFEILIQTNILDNYLVVVTLVMNKHVLLLIQRLYQEETSY